MSNNYAIISLLKLRGADAHNGVLSEADRSISGNNVDKSRTHKNIILTENLYKNYDHFIEVKQAEIDEANIPDKIWNKENPNKKIKLRRFPRKLKNKKTKKNELPALSQQIVITHSPGIMSESDSIIYLKCAYDFIQEWFSDNEVISSIIHLDETTPHLHIDIAFFDKNDKRFNQRILSKTGKTNYRKIRAAFQKEVAEGFGLIAQDGSVVKKGTHEQRADLNRAADKERLANTKKELSKAKNEVFLIKKEKDLVIKKLQEEEKQSKKLLNEKDVQITSYVTLLAEKEKQIYDLENKKPEIVEVVKIIKDNSKSVDIEKLKNRIRYLEKEHEEFVNRPSLSDWKKRELEINNLKEEKKKLSSIVKNLPTIEDYKTLKDKNADLKAENDSLEAKIVFLPTHDDMKKVKEINKTLREENRDLKTQNDELQKKLETVELKTKDPRDKLQDTALQSTESLKQKEIKKSNIKLISNFDEYPENDFESSLGNMKTLK